MKTRKWVNIQENWISTEEQWPQIDAHVKHVNGTFVYDKLEWVQLDASDSPNSLYYLWACVIYFVLYCGNNQFLNLMSYTN